MSNDKQDLSVQEVPIASSHEDAFKARRRRLVSSGLGASAIVATVVSRPAWANGICTKSGLQSANLSGQHTFTGCGKSAGFWKRKQSSWPAEVSPSLSFTSVFGSAPYGYSGTASKTLFEGKSLGEVISVSGSDDTNPGNIGKHLVGAYVNSVAFPKLSGRGFVYSSTEVVNLFATAKASATGKGQEAQKLIYKTLAVLLENANNRFDGNTEWDH